MRMGVVKVTYEVVVDLDNEEMVEDAKDVLYEDLTQIYKFDNLADIIGTEENYQKSPNDIPDHLLELHDPDHPNYDG